MNQRRIILIDATPESIVPTYTQNPLFQTWLDCFDNMGRALEFIAEPRPPYCLDVFLARDHIEDDVQLPGTNDPAVPILELFCGLNTILHVTILCPDDDTDLERIMRGLITDPRMLKDPVAQTNIPSYICQQGMQYLQEKNVYHVNNNEVHLTENIQRDIDELYNYLRDILNDQDRRLRALQEAFSNKPGEEPS